MHILLINPAHLSIGSRMPNEHLPPLGLLSIGGPLIDAGQTVRLLDADYHNYSVEKVAECVVADRPDVIMLGHSGSTSAQPIINDITRLVKAALPHVTVIIGGVFPTYHWAEILQTQPQIDYIVCGEGEETVLKVVATLQADAPVAHIRGIALRIDGVPTQTLAAANIKNLDDFRIGWEQSQASPTPACVHDPARFRSPFLRSICAAHAR